MSKTDPHLDDFAFRCFRDMADEDYVAARMSYRASLLQPFLWSSLQAIEKYFKCSLLLRRVSSKGVGHDLQKALELLKSSMGLDLSLTESTTSFLEHLDREGRSRYFQGSRHVTATSLVELDRAVWEIRRFCSGDEAIWALQLQHGQMPEKYSLRNGRIEKILAGAKCFSRDALIWQNGFVGTPRRKVQPGGGFKAENAPLFLRPALLDEVLKYVQLESDWIEAYRRHLDEHPLR